MRDFLVDIVGHTQPLGIDLVRVIGDNSSTKLDTATADKKLIMKAEFTQASPLFEGTFGMPNLGTLNTILNIPEYRENAQINITKKNRDGINVPDSISFLNATGDFSNNYRFMAGNLINDKLKDVRFKGATWHITMEPTMANIARLKYQAQANSDEAYFIAKTDGNDLKFYFGDPSSHAGDFVFQHAVAGKLTRGWYWNVGVFQGILNLHGDKVIQFSDDGVAQIIVDSGLIKYEYLLPAETK
jgi:hypothetical protein